ncbi:unnamed protein product [Rotaria socialis]|uniref:Uncharacterized protein n=2 Tax=Rotaria socialis TaxID=392032 RepID=A0A818FGR9_9BILA|nr:unnamed protein product [Rotaria socialis]
MMQNSIQRHSYPPRARNPSARMPYPQLYQQQPVVKKIRDYLFWSIINIFIGGIVAGLIAVLFSYFTREQKRVNNLNEAKKWSRRALICNILTTTLGIISICLLIALPIGLSVGLSSSSSSSSTNSASFSSSTVSCSCTLSSGTCTGNIGGSVTATSCSGCDAACKTAYSSSCTSATITGSC